MIHTSLRKYFVVFITYLSFSSTCLTMNSQFTENDIFLGSQAYTNRPLNGYPQLSKQLQNAAALNQMLQAINNLEIQHNKNNQTTEAKEAINQTLQNLYKELGQISSLHGNIDAKLGRAIAAGLAGVTIDEPIENVTEGLKLGTLMRVTKVCGNVLSKRIEGTVDNVLGGIWDFLFDSLINLWNSADQIVFHGGNKPFSIQELKGWNELIKSCFEDIERLVKDGIKDNLRGRDMTLRQLDDDTNTIQQHISVWRFLIGGYIRQFDYFISLIDQHIEYYQKNSDVFFLAEEIKRRLIEFIQILKKATEIKDLDVALDSSKGLIPAFRKNITTIIARLIEQIEPNVRLSYKTTDFIKQNTRNKDNASRDNDEEYPRSFQVGW